MKKLIVLSLVSAFFACGASAEPVKQHIDTIRTATNRSVQATAQNMATRAGRMATTQAIRTAKSKEARPWQASRR